MKIILNSEGSGELYLRIMKAICGETNDKSMVDLMCHHAPYTQMLGFSSGSYVDILDRGLDNENDQQYFIKSDVISFLKKNNRTYDVSICSDGIEHLSKADGVVLIYLMKLHSEKQILFTPLGEYMTAIETDTNPDTHKSGWQPEDLENWASVVLPNFHPSLKIGAFFAWHCENIQQDFERVSNELKSII